MQGSLLGKPACGIRLHKLQAHLVRRILVSRPNRVTELRAQPQSKGPGGPTQPPKNGGGGGGGGQGGGQHTEEAKLALQDVAVREDVIVLDVSGMHCGGCASRVKRLLEEHECVSKASVNLATEVALVRLSLPLLPESGARGGAKADELQTVVAQLLKVLAENGFKGKLRDKRQSNAASAAIVKSRRAERVRR